jgi:hypothetical protein
MSDYDERYVLIFGYDLTGAVIERIIYDKQNLDMYLSTLRMGIPPSLSHRRTDGYYVLHFRRIEALHSDFPLDDTVSERLATEGNEIHAYGFVDDKKLSPSQSDGAIAVFFDTDWGVLEIAAQHIVYEI